MAGPESAKPRSLIYPGESMQKFPDPWRERLSGSTEVDETLHRVSQQLFPSLVSYTKALDIRCHFVL